jgi:hypothetical protein
MDTKEHQDFVDDIEYFNNKLFKSLGIPKKYLGTGSSYFDKKNEEKFKNYTLLHMIQLTFKQRLYLAWWTLFDKKRINLFYEGISKGKSVYFSFVDTLNYK